MRQLLAAAGVALAASLCASAAHAGQTLDAIRTRGQLVCGVSSATPGFAMSDGKGGYDGLDADFCRALSAAVFGVPDKVKFVPLTAPGRFTALQSGAIDVLARNSTWTLQREGTLGIVFGPVVFYDGQGFMVPKKLGVKSAKDLSGSTICVQPSTTTEDNLQDYFRSNKLQLKPVVIEDLGEIEKAFFTGRCDVYTTDASGLAGTREARAANPDDYVILPERISKEPLALAVRRGDDQWFDIVRWTVFATIAAEERGIGSKSVDDAMASQDPDVQRLLGIVPGNGKALGLDEKWAYNVIKTVGNYGEIFDRNVGKGSALKLDRGLNDLWSKGGLMYAPPLR